MLKTWMITVLLCLVSFSGVYGEVRTINAVHTVWFPYTDQENGKSIGFEIEIFKRVMETMNVAVTFHNYPWKRCLNYLENGQADVLISMLKTPEREKYACYPDTPISVSRTVFFTTKEQAIDYTGSYNELKDYSIGVIMGFSYGEAFDHADDLKKDPAKNTRTLIRKLLYGRNDIAAENKAVVLATALEMGVTDRIKFLDPPIHTQKLYAGFSRANTLEPFCKEFSQALSRFKTTEAYGAILLKYGIDPSEMQ